MRHSLLLGVACFCAAGTSFAQQSGESDPADQTVIVADLIVYNPIQVYGDRTEAEPGSVSYVTADEIDAVMADHPAEILNTLPGVNISINSGQEHLIAIRSPVLSGGAGQGSFLILENGVPTRAAAFGNVNSLIEPHHETADTIEVVRGPGSARYGSNAEHGLINVIQAPPTGFNSLDLTASYSTLNRYRTDMVGNTSGGLRAALSLMDEVGWRDNTGTEQQKLTLIQDFDIGGWDMQGFLSASNLNQESAGYAEGRDAYKDGDIYKADPNPEAFRDAWAVRGHLRMERAFEDGTLTLIPYARTQWMEFRQHFLPYKGYEENGHDSAGLMARFDVASEGPVEVSFGLDGEVATGFLIETQPEPFGFFPGDTRFPVGKHYDYDVDTRSLALWGEATWHVSEDLRVLAGLRAETHHFDYTTNIAPYTGGRFKVPGDRTDAFDLVTPKLGAIWTLGDVDLYANYARGERVPQVSDLYRLQNLQEAGEIEPESLDSIEIGVRGYALGGLLYYDVAAYHMEKDNFFFRDSDGLNVTDGATDHTGVEGAFSWEIVQDIVKLDGQVSWSDQTYTFDRVTGSADETILDGNEIDSAPEWLGDLAVVWTPTQEFSLRLSGEYVGEYYTNPANTDVYPGHTVFNARADYTLTDGLDLFVIVRNLADERYADRADFAFGNPRYFPGEPLNATVGVKARLG